MLDIIIQQKLIAKPPYEIMHYSLQDMTLSLSMLVENWGMAEILYSPA